jgi:WD40 repeat protein
MADTFQFDVFLSHSAKDKAVVRPLAERLRKDGLKVWFDEWVLKAGDSIPAKIEEGLEHSRVLVLCMSANAFGSDWAQLEAGTFRFRDPLNRERRFIPLRLDDAPIKGSLAQFLFINWLSAVRDQEYAKILEACRPIRVEPTQPHSLESSGKAEGCIVFAHHDSVYTVAVTPDGRWIIADTVKSRLKKIEFNPSQESLLGRDVGRQAESAPLVRGLTVTPDGEHVISSSSSPAVEVWRLRDMERIRIFRLLRRPACCVGVSADGTRVVAGCYDGTIGVWDFDTGRQVSVFRAHKMSVKAVVVTPDGQSVVSGSEDCRIGIWDIATGEKRAILEGHSGGVVALALTHDGTTLISGSHDKTMRIWDLAHKRCSATLEGHTHRVFSLAMTADDAIIVSGSSDKTIRSWDLRSRVCFGILHGHSKSIRSVCVTPDGHWVVSGSVDGTVRIWPMPIKKPDSSYAFIVGEKSSGKTLHLNLFLSTQVRYTNAKVLLVGESGVGKTGLSNYLAHDIKVEDDKPLASTDGAWATHWPLKHDKKKAGVEREIWLWDFAGQVDYRLVHQLYMDDTGAAVLVFNPQNENPFEGLGHWDRDLQKAARKPFAKLLVAARIDRGGLVVGAASIKKFMKERGFVGPLHETSAKTGKGCEELREAIVRAIDWKSLRRQRHPRSTAG